MYALRKFPILFALVLSLLISSTPLRADKLDPRCAGRVSQIVSGAKNKFWNVVDYVDARADRWDFGAGRLAGWSPAITSVAAMSLGIIFALGGPGAVSEMLFTDNDSDYDSETGTLRADYVFKDAVTFPDGTTLPPGTKLKDYEEARSAYYQRKREAFEARMLALEERLKQREAERIAKLNEKMRRESEEWQRRIAEREAKLKKDQEAIGGESLETGFSNPKPEKDPTKDDTP